MKTVLLLWSVFALSVGSVGMAAESNIPAGTIIPVTLSSSLDAKKSRPGQMLIARVAQDVPLYNGAEIKAGTRVLGEVLAVTPAENSQAATIALRFDRIEIAGQTIPLSTDLRALASPLEVNQAQTSIAGQDWGSDPPWDQTTNQIGGDVVYRGAGTVNDGLKTVGRSVYAGAWGVLSEVASSPGTECRGPVAGNDKEQALWVFSHDACGTYGYDAVITHAGRTNPEGRIVLASTKGDLKLRGGSALLLRVNGSGSQLSHGDVASK